MPTRFWLRPKWVFGHVLCLALVVLFVNLGFWQLRRLDEKQARNALIEARSAGDPVPLEEALAGGATDARYRRVAASGTWAADETVLVHSRSYDGAPGYHVVTPLVLDGGDAIFVNRGFAPLGAGDEDTVHELVRPPAGEADVEGILLASERRGSFGPRDTEGEELRVVSRIDVERLQQQVDEPVAPVYLQLTAVEPAGEPPPVVLPEPRQDEGPHFGYAMQWFIFATVGAVGWPLLLRKTARDRNRDVPDEVPQSA